MRLRAVFCLLSAPCHSGRMSRQALNDYTNIPLRYELVPEIVILEPVKGADAEKFIKAVHPAVRTQRELHQSLHAAPLRLAISDARCAAPVMDARTRTPQDADKQSCYAVEKGELRVKRQRGCRACRERVRMLSGEAPYEGRIQMRRIKEHYIFTIESVGQMPPEELFVEAVNILQEKCATLLSVM